MKIGRNQLCPCGSGIKFKRCCIDLKPDDLPLPGPRRPEPLVVGHLRQESRPFETFYQAERKKITRPLIWIQSSTLDETIKAKASVFTTGTQWLELRWIPVPSEFAQAVAHEMMHLVI